MSQESDHPDSDSTPDETEEGSRTRRSKYAAYANRNINKTPAAYANRNINKTPAAYTNRPASKTHTDTPRTKTVPPLPRRKSFAPRKSKLEYDNTIQKDRGGCLSALLTFMFIGNIVVFIASYGSVRPNSSAAGIIPIAGLIVLAVLVCIVGLWNWKSWGFMGLIIAFGFQLVIGLLTANITATIGSILYLVLLIGLMNDKMDLLEA